MTYERWKEIDNDVRRPSFHFENDNQSNVTKEEYDKKIYYNGRHRARDERSFVMRAILMVVLFFGVLFAIPMSIGLIHNHFRTQALENLTGKDLNYWDVYFAGSEIEAVSQLQDTKNK